MSDFLNARVIGDRLVWEPLVGLDWAGGPANLLAALCQSLPSTAEGGRSRCSGTSWPVTQLGADAVGGTLEFLLACLATVLVMLLLYTSISSQQEGETYPSLSMISHGVTG